MVIYYGPAINANNHVVVSTVDGAMTPSMPPSNGKVMPDLADRFRTGGVVAASPRIIRR